MSAIRHFDVVGWCPLHRSRAIVQRCTERVYVVRFAKEDVPSATMTVSGMLYYENILFDCPYEMSNVTVNFYGDSHPSPEVKKSPYGDPISLSDIPRQGDVAIVYDRDVAIDVWLKPWILDTSAPWLPEDESS